MCLGRHPVLWLKAELVFCLSFLFLVFIPPGDQRLVYQRSNAWRFEAPRQLLSTGISLSRCSARWTSQPPTLVFVVSPGFCSNTYAFAWRADGDSVTTQRLLSAGILMSRGGVHWASVPPPLVFGFRLISFDIWRVRTSRLRPHPPRTVIAIITLRESRLFLDYLSCSDFADDLLCGDQFLTTCMYLFLKRFFFFFNYLYVFFF